MALVEEALAGGLFHIVITSGTTLLTAEGPTRTLQAITYAAAQGQAIPTEEISADATMEGINTTVTRESQIQVTNMDTDKGEKETL